MKDENGRWIPDLSEKQFLIFDCFKRMLLVCGPRKSSKTRGILHKILRHMWEVDGARVAMFSRTMKNSKDAGPWSILMRETIPQWVKANIGFRLATFTDKGKPGFKVDGQTRTPYFRIRNMHGGESECMLFSLDDVKEAEAKLKEMEFSLIYFSELDKFDDRRVLSVGILSLRGGGIPFDKMQWIADCNPSEDGEASWIYKVWFKERVQSYEDYTIENKKLGLPTLTEPQFLTNQQNLELIEIMLEDNPFLDPREIEEIKATYGYDPGLYARYVLGQWIYGDGDQSRHFRGHFHEHTHRVGNISDPDENKWEVLLPSDGCTELVLGFDLGDVNHAATIWEELVFGGRPCFNLLDELVSLGKEVSNEDFVLEFMEKIERLEYHLGRRLDLSRAWSDSDALEKFHATGAPYRADEVENASEGRIQLIGVKKGPRSVRERVQLTKKLLGQRRLLISAHCTNFLAMMKNLKKGTGPLDFVLRSDPNKHVFDAGTYALIGEVGEEDGVRHRVGRRPPLLVQA